MEIAKRLAEDTPGLASVQAAVHSRGIPIPFTIRSCIENAGAIRIGNDHRDVPRSQIGAESMPTETCVEALEEPLLPDEDENVRRISRIDRQGPGVGGPNDPLVRRAPAPSAVDT